MLEMKTTTKISKVDDKLHEIEQLINSQFVPGEYKNKYLYCNPDRCLDWYYDLSKNNLDIIIGSDCPSGCGNSLNTSSIIVREVVADNGKNYYMHIILKNNEDLSIFINLISDLIAYSDACTSGEEGIAMIIERFSMWKSMLKHRGESRGTAKGIIGELYTIINLLECGVDPISVIDGWTGPEMAQQDFIFSSFWVETKTISTHKSTVTINSLGQLDKPEIPGYLYVVFADQCTEYDDGAVWVEKLYDKICELVSDNPSALLKFKTKMKEFEYDRFCLPIPDPYVCKIDKDKVYEVKDKFPRLYNSYNMNGIKTVHYELLLSVIDKWGVKEGVSVWQSKTK